MAKKFEEMTAEEKNEAFQKWIAGRESRKGQNVAKRKATQQLIAKYKGEYNKLLAAAGGKVTAAE